jgi:hypothetical protein
LCGRVVNAAATGGRISSQLTEKKRETTERYLDNKN